MIQLPMTCAFWLSTHRKKLIKNKNEAELKNLLPDADTGFYSAGLNQKTQDAQIVFAGIQSIANAKIQHYEILIIDECHLVDPMSRDSTTH
jgi:DNA or RNA helicases of superfamily II